MPAIIVAFQVLPSGVEDTYGCVEAAIAVVAESGLPYDVSSFETTVEGEYDELMALIKEAQQACLDFGASSVLCNVKIANTPAGTTIADHIGKFRG